MQAVQDSSGMIPWYSQSSEAEHVSLSFSRQGGVCVASKYSCYSLIKAFLYCTAVLVSSQELLRIGNPCHTQRRWALSGPRWARAPQCHGKV